MDQRLKKLRKYIDIIDKQILDLLENRMNIVKEVGYKICLSLNGTNNCNGKSCNSLCKGIMKEYIPIILENLIDNQL